MFEICSNNKKNTRRYECHVLNPLVRDDDSTECHLTKIYTKNYVRYETGNP